jgi:hypothetical protein
MVSSAAMGSQSPSNKKKMEKAIASYISKLEKEHENLKSKKIEVLGVRDINRQYEILSHLRALLQERLDRGDVSQLALNIGPPVVEVVRQNPKKEHLMEECTCILYFLSIFDPYFKKGVARLFKALQDHSDNESIHKASLAAIRNIVAANRESLPRVAPSTPIVLDSMDTFPGNIDLLSSALEILENLASHMPNKSYFVESGALRQLQNTMKDHIHDAAIQGTILRALSNLSFEAGSSVRSEMLPMLSLVLESMREHPKYPKVQMYGCCTLQNLSSFASMTSPSQSDGEEVTTDGFRTILGVMKDHVEDSMLQEQGIKTLHEMIKDAPEQVDWIIDQDGITTIVEGMTRYSHVLDVQVEGLGILQLLAFRSSDNHELIFSLGGVDVLLAAMITYPDNVKVSLSGVNILKDFTRISLDFQRAVSAKGGIGVILNAMKRHAHNDDIQDPAFACMRNLCLNHDNRETVRKEGWVPVALANMTNLKSNPAIQAYGCDALGRLSSIAVEEIYIHHGIEVALESMAEHSSHAGVQDRACFLLLNLTEHKPALAHMKEHKVLPIVQAAKVPPKEQALERKKELISRLSSLDIRPASWFRK